MAETQPSPLKRRRNWPVVVVGLLVAAFLWFIFPKLIAPVGPYKSTPAFVEPVQILGAGIMIFCPWWPLIRRKDPPARTWMFVLSAVAGVPYLVLLGAFAVFLLSFAADLWDFLLLLMAHLSVTVAVLRRPRLFLPWSLSTAVGTPALVYGSALFLHPGADNPALAALPFYGLVFGPLVGLAFAWLWRWRATVRHNRKVQLPQQGVADAATGG